jgi:hypothetical protein
VTTTVAWDEPEEIGFGNGRRALLWRDSGGDPAALPDVLGLDAGQAVIVISGGAADLNQAGRIRAERLLGPGVAAAAGAAGAVVVDGGTAAGVMQVTGAARARWPDRIPLLVGVAPRGQVGQFGDQAALDDNHTHFILADSDAWGGETKLLIGLAAALAFPWRPAMVLAGGGPVARTEVLAAVRRGWPVFVISGTGGLADDLLRLIDQPAPDDADLQEIIATGDLRRVDGDEPGQFARKLAWEIQDEPVLKLAWREFAAYDHQATRLRLFFTRFQRLILGLGVAATLLALIVAETDKQGLDWLVALIPATSAVLVAIAGRQATGPRWVLLRAAAETLKAEIYRYRTRTPPYNGGPDDRGRQLAGNVDVIIGQLMQTEVSGGELTPYQGPLPPRMYGAGADDDGLSPLDPKQYLHIRVGDQLRYYQKKVRELARRRTALQCLAIAAGGAGTVLAAAGLDIWVGLTGGIAAAALAYVAHLQFDNTIVTYNQTAARLAAQDRQWQARPAASRDLAAFAQLVTRTEAALTAELAGWVQQMNDAMTELKDSQDHELAQAEHADG